MYIVYITEESYSYYGVDEILTGEVDPLPVLDAYIATATDGLCTSWEAGENQATGTITDPEYWQQRKAITEARKGARDALLAAGFKVTPALEVWLG